MAGIIPPELGQLHDLAHLLLNNNQLTGGIPDELGQLHSLAELRLSLNRLTGNVPSTLAGLTNLKVLTIDGNADMSGTLPQELTSLSLDELFMDGTQLCTPADAGFQDWLRAIPNYRLGDCRSTFAGLTAYLTQATQSLQSNPVPLVAGEEALLRVFVTSNGEVDAAIPPRPGDLIQGRGPRAYN